MSFHVFINVHGHVSSVLPPQLSAVQSLRRRPQNESGPHAVASDSTVTPSALLRKAPRSLTRLPLHGLPAGETLMEREKLMRLRDGGRASRGAALLSQRPLMTLLLRPLLWAEGLYFRLQRVNAANTRWPPSQTRATQRRRGRRVHTFPLGAMTQSSCNCLSSSFLRQSAAHLVTHTHTHTAHTHTARMHSWHMCWIRGRKGNQRHERPK